MRQNKEELPLVIDTLGVTLRALRQMVQFSPDQEYARLLEDFKERRLAELHPFFNACYCPGGQENHAIGHAVLAFGISGLCLRD